MRNNEYPLSQYLKFTLFTSWFFIQFLLAKQTRKLHTKHSIAKQIAKNWQEQLPTMPLIQYYKLVLLQLQFTNSFSMLCDLEKEHYIIHKLHKNIFT